MDVRKIEESLSVGPQLTPEDVPSLAQAGFDTIICNRPDGESADQPSHADIAEAAKNAGLAMHYLPIVPGRFDDQTVAALAQLLTEGSNQIFAYCRTGMRSTTLWALARADQHDKAKIVQKAQNAGYDIAGILQNLRPD